MKKAFSILASFACAIIAVQAGLDVPKDVLTADQLSDAISKAQSEKKPIAFVYTDPGTT